MKKNILLLVILFAFSQISFGQTIPINGDIVFTQIGSDSPDVIEFITLTRLSLITLKITDKGILADGTLRSGEGIFDLSNTTWTDIPGGTFIRLGADLANDDDASDRIIVYNGIGSGTLPNITGVGDQCIAYLGTTSVPTYIAGLFIGGTWNSGATSTDDSKAPGTLSDIELGTLDNQYFNSTVDGDANATRTALINSSNWTGQSSAAIGYINLTSNIGNTSLPVELTSFTAASTSSATVVLNWTTATEVNNYGFEIERTSTPLSPRSEDERSISWETLAFVEGHGNSNSPKEYIYIDATVAERSRSYRLKQIDTDGSFEYSDIVTVNGNLSKIELFQNHPNPFNPSTNISFTIPEQSNVKLNVYNVLGELIEQLVDKNLEAGYYKYQWDASNKSQFTSGIYFYSLSVNGFREVKKMNLVK